MTCPYMEPYARDPCGKDATSAGYCEYHSTRKCRYCKKQANRDCSFAGGLICGTPLCSNCSCFHKMCGGHKRDDR